MCEIFCIMCDKDFSKCNCLSVESINGYRKNDNRFYKGKKWNVAKLFCDGVMLLERRTILGNNKKIIV